MPPFPAWHFRTMEAGEVHVDPVHDEFFKMQDLVDALVRESVQNSLDARRGRAPVRVRFRFGAGADALPARSAEPYLRGLRPHLEAVGPSLHSVLPGRDEPVPYLLIEDFGTRGLTGDPAGDPELDGIETKNDFFFFWRNVGRSNKSERDRGRWGLGKAVFSVASRIRTIFGLTIRSDDRRALLLGQSVLKTHIINGSRKYPYGFFARREPRDALPLPIEDSPMIGRFFDDFGLSRTEPGLSVVIPFFRDDELSFETIIESAIRQYFYPIIKGDLTVELVEGNRGETISRVTIDDVSRRFGGESSSDVMKLSALTKWSFGELASTPIEIIADATGSKWTEELFAGRLPLLRERFERGERIAVRAHLSIRRKTANTPARSFFDVYLEKDNSLKRGQPHFIRRGITIPDVKNDVKKSVRALVVIDDEALSTFLGDAENPSHSDWSERADKLQTHYVHHRTTLRFVKNSVADLASMLSRPPEGRIRDFLQDIFSIDVPEPDVASGGTAPRPVAHAGQSTIGEGPARGHAAPGVTISPVAGGFTIRGSERSLVGKLMRAELAYRIRTGNPFQKHSPFDFSLEDVGIVRKMEGADIRDAQANVMTFLVTAPNFHVTVKGFDPRRDLIVRVAEVENDAAEAELY